MYVWKIYIYILLLSNKRKQAFAPIRFILLNFKSFAYFDHVAILMLWFFFSVVPSPQVIPSRKFVDFPSWNDDKNKSILVRGYNKEIVLKKKKKQTYGNIYHNSA